MIAMPSRCMRFLPADVQFDGQRGSRPKRLCARPQYRDNFRDEGRFSTWLFAIAHNVKNDYLRKVLRRREELSAGRHDPVDPGDLAADVEKSERAAAVMRAIERLSPVQREALVLFRSRA